MAQQYKLIHPVKYYRDYLNSDIRPDGRETDKCRPVALNMGSITTADGSAVVKIGNTNVICGIRAELAKPKPSEPDVGFLIPVVELPQMCAVKYRNHAGANEDTDVYSCAINDILVNSDCLDLKELCIHSDKLVWAIYCDIICIDFDGSFLDAAILACVAALKTLKLPKVIYDVEINDIKVDNSVMSAVDVKALPICTTFMTFDDQVIITDPTAEEENLSSSIVNIAASKGDICFVRKPGGTPLSEVQMEKLFKQALDRETELLKILKDCFSQQNHTINQME